MAVFSNACIIPPGIPTAFENTVLLFLTIGFRFSTLETFLGTFLETLTFNFFPETFLGTFLETLTFETFLGTFLETFLENFFETFTFNFFPRTFFKTLLETSFCFFKTRAGFFATGFLTDLVDLNSFFCDLTGFLTFLTGLTLSKDSF
ncbi:MAG: hypothetical protein J7K00_01365 [Candidatus Diapherotrites archaeon]|nr:hypothetical protein [Candidatus Diapherotrites archaeon]